MADERTYQLLPTTSGELEAACMTCGRRLRAGQPLVLVPRDVVNETTVVDGTPVADVLCVYCDPLPA